MNGEKHLRVFVISGPSGVGKSTIIHGAMALLPELRLSVSSTTRAPRLGEADGRDYHFIGQEEFDHKIKAQEFLEWAQVFDNYYGTSAFEVARIFEEGCHALLDVDVQGVKTIKSTTEGAAYFFIMPPSTEELSARLRNRGTESEESLGKRLAKAEFEAGHAHLYDHTIINDDADRATGELVDLFLSEEQKDIPFRRLAAGEQGAASEQGTARPEALVRTITREMRAGLREELISLIDSHVRAALERDLDRLILDAFREHRRRGS